MTREQVRVNLRIAAVEFVSAKEIDLLFGGYDRTRDAAARLERAAMEFVKAFGTTLPPTDGELD